MRHLLAAFVYLALTSAACAQAPSAEQIDAIVDKALKHWRAPGVAVAVVFEDRLVYLKGAGVKEVGKADPVTADTIFPLSSCSKTLTATVLAMLVDDVNVKIGWDDPVRKHLPWFKLADPLANDNVTLRDLLSHRTGLGAHEPLWYRTPLTMEERVRRLAFIEPSHAFRTTFQYQAIAFGAAGLAGAQAASTTWEDMMQRRLFKPLDMKTASAVYPGDGKADYASPHRRTGQRMAVIERYPYDQPDPAASVHASVRDLSKFLRFQLNGGLAQGRRILSTKNLLETHAPRMIIPRQGLARTMSPHSNIIAYGHGWVVQDYRGLGVLMHGGMIAGFRAQITLVPDSRLGIAVLSNLDLTWMNYALSHTLIDRFCQLTAKDWNTYCLDVELADELNERQTEQAILAARKPHLKHTLPLASYAGTYHDPAYGTCEFQTVNGQLHWKWNNVQSRLEHFQNDTFMAQDDPVKTMLFAFQLNEKKDAVEAFVAMERKFHKK